MNKQRPIRYLLAALAVVVALTTIGCGGGDEQGGRSSSGGVAVVAAVIGIGGWLAKSLISKVTTDDASAEAALQQLSLRIGKSTEFTTAGNLGYVALISGNGSVARNHELCKRFLDAISQEKVSAQQEAESPSSAHITVWLISTPPSKSLDLSSCDDLLEYYDYEDSKSLLKMARIGFGAGPVLISRLHSAVNNKLMKNRPLLVWDLSPISSPDFGLVLKAWAMMQMLSAEELKEALAEASFDGAVEKIAGIAASRVYRREEILIAVQD